MRNSVIRLTTLFAFMILLCVVLAKDVNANTYKKSLDDVKFSEYDSIRAVHLGKDETHIPEYYEVMIYNNMCNLVSITVDEANPVLSSSGGVLYNKDKTMLVCFPPGLKSANIPETCVNILPQALKGTSMSIKKQVKAQITKNNNGTWPGFYRYVNKPYKEERENVSQLLK